MTFETVYTKNLRKGDRVLFYGAIFTITEDAKNHGQKWTEKKKGEEFDVWTAKCECVEVEEGTSLTSLLRKYDTFQSNSLNAEYCKIID